MTWPDNCVCERNFYLFPFSVEIRPFTPFVETINLHETPILPTIYDTSTTVHVVLYVSKRIRTRRLGIFRNLSNGIDLKSMICFDRRNRDELLFIKSFTLFIHWYQKFIHQWWNSSKFNDIFDKRTHDKEKLFQNPTEYLIYIYISSIVNSWRRTFLGGEIKNGGTRTSWNFKTLLYNCLNIRDVSFTYSLRETWATSSL